MCFGGAGRPGSYRLRGALLITSYRIRMAKSGPDRCGPIASRVSIPKPVNSPIIYSPGRQIFDVCSYTIRLRRSRSGWAAITAHPCLNWSRPTNFPVSQPETRRPDSKEYRAFFWSRISYACMIHSLPEGLQVSETHLSHSAANFVTWMIKRIPAAVFLEDKTPFIAMLATQ